jgi:Immunity protein 26
MVLFPVSNNIYPYLPKSAKTLIVGDFFALPLSNHMYGCAQVLEVIEKGVASSSLFAFGVLNCHSSFLPSEDNLKGKTLLASGITHINAVTKNNFEILGNVRLPSTAPTKSFFNFSVGSSQNHWGWNSIIKKTENLLIDAT